MFAVGIFAFDGAIRDAGSAIKPVGRNVCLTAKASGTFTVRTTKCDPSDKAQQWNYDPMKKGLFNNAGIKLFNNWGTLLAETEKGTWYGEFDYSVVNTTLTMPAKPAGLSTPQMKEVGPWCLYSMDFQAHGSVTDAAGDYYVILRTASDYGFCGDNSSKWEITDHDD